MFKIKVLHVHNYYIQSGGEDTVLASEIQLLRDRGHSVVKYYDYNKRIILTDPVSVALETIWSWPSYRKILKIVQEERPDIAHFHNTFPLISPSAYYACYQAKVPVVQTLHNYRLICPSAIFFRDGHVCEDCAGKFFPFPGIVHKCYRGSSFGSATVATMLAVHRTMGTWRKKIDAFISLTEFAKLKFVEQGIPNHKIFIKHPFVYPDPKVDEHERGYALFVGRLVPEKGIPQIVEAWQKWGLEIPLKVVGEGPMFPASYRFPYQEGWIEWCGPKALERVYELMAGARFLIVPSVWYETFGRVAIEAFAQGTPVLISDIGALKEVVADGISGIYLRAGDPADLANKVRWAWEHPDAMAEMGHNARKEYELKYTAERNYDMLMDVYQKAMERRAENRLDDDTKSLK